MILSNPKSPFNIDSFVMKPLWQRTLCEGQSSFNLIIIYMTTEYFKSRVLLLDSISIRPQDVKIAQKTIGAQPATHYQHAQRVLLEKGWVPA